MKVHLRFSRLVFASLLFVATWLGAQKSSAQNANQIVYANGLSNSWVSYSWATVNFNNTSPVHSGSDSISVSCLGSDYEALYLHHTAQDASQFTNLTFWIYSAHSGNQQLQIQGTLNGNAQTAFQMPSLISNTWTLVTVPLSAIGISGSPDFDGFWIQSQSGSPLPTFYVDDISLTAITNVSNGTNAAAAITVDAGANRHPISPLIYGVAFAAAAQVADLNVPLNRCGGNSETRYNWQIDAHNHAADYYFESIGDSANGTSGAADDSFISETLAGGAKPLMTVPMIGWAPKLGPGRAKLGSYSVTKYGPQTSTDIYFPDSGNGISITNNTPITWNDPNDANVPVNSAFEKIWVQHLTNTWGMSTNGGVGYYLMDNEHSIWFSTHQDIHPIGPTMQEIYGKIIDYATMVKSVDSNALVLGPEEFGWSGYLYSGYDQQWAGQNNNFNPAQYPDRGSNGGWDYMPWLLNQLHQQATNTGERLLDYFTVHWYPQSGESVTNLGDTSLQLLRNRSTRSLWDSNYVDVSYVNSVVQLIPRLQGWAAEYYPGTKVGITEYNWGAENYMNGATTQADVMGILGRQGLDLATRWTTPDPSTPTYLAMKLYRNYDGKKSTFGDTSISAGGPNPDDVSTFAASRASDGALTVMVINKYLSGVTPMIVNVTNFISTGTAQVWQVNSNNAIAHLSNINFSNGTLSLTAPSPSVTLLVIPAAQPALRAGAARTDSQFQFSLTGEIGQTYVIQSSADLISWTTLSTNVLASTQTNFLLPGGSTEQFYRAKLLP